MRSLGVAMRHCAAIYLVESAILAISGGLAGALAAILTLDVQLLAVLNAVIGFFASYMLGTLISVLSLGRVSIVRLLSKAD
jgi:ABC-type lipoprotein release transport system permease subunit